MTVQKLLPLLLVLVVGCAAPRAKNTQRDSAPADTLKDGQVVEDRSLRVVFHPHALEVFVRRGKEWKPVAQVRSEAGFLPYVAIRKHNIEFSAMDAQVEVLGKKTAALFPGLEFLEGDEFSSTDRDAHGALADRRRPAVAKVTVPLMAYEVDGALVSLMWNTPTIFQPFFEAREKNLMGLSWLPNLSVSGSLSYYLCIEPGATILDAVPRWTETFGLPKPEPWPRTLEEEIALCKTGFQTVGDPSGQYRHCVGWALAWAPGFDVLRHLAGEKIDWAKYPDLLSSANCHILRWEAPFYAGKTELAKNLIPAMKDLAAKRVNGEWTFQPHNEQQAALGKRGDTVVGTSAANAFMVIKAARMTGDPELKSAALETLQILRKYKVPRGAQAWECPLYEPDILAAAYGVGANVEAYKLTGDKAYLAEASRWAKTGLPFLYTWNLPDHHGMLYGSIPVFGTSFYTGSWFGVAVQWNGLVYAYYLRKLAPLDKSYDWLRVADGITASAVHQQYTEGPSKGCYPDGFYDAFTRRSPADINPEDILINILTAQGKDPDPDLKLK